MICWSIRWLLRSVWLHSSIFFNEAKVGRSRKPSWTGLGAGWSHTRRHGVGRR